LGYAPCAQVLQELAADADLALPVESLSLDTAWHVLEIFRMREGFTRQDAADVECAFRLAHDSETWAKDDNLEKAHSHAHVSVKERQADIRDFKKSLAGPQLGMIQETQPLTEPEPSDESEEDGNSDETDSCEIDKLDVGKALRWLGYDSSFQVMQHLIREVDVDESGKLGIVEFKKLVRMYRERELRQMPNSLFKLGVLGKRHMENQHLKLNEDHVRLALGALGCSKREVEVEFRDTPMPMDGYDIHTTIAAAMRCRDRMRRFYRENLGFGPEEVKKFQAMFQQFDKDDSGTVDSSELQILFERMLPGMATSKMFRPKLLEILSRAGIGVDGDKNSTVEFSKFLRLVREFHDLSEQERLSLEEGTILKSLFSSAEVKAFREIFIFLDEDGRDCLSFDQVKEMIAGVAPLGDKLIGRLRTMWPGKASDDSQRGDLGTIDFPEFLNLMKQLLDVNFGGIKDKTQASHPSRKVTRHLQTVSGHL